ncbi:MAG: NADH-quinone oxidoreductase subunit F [Flavobacteriales bacterium]|jgi:NADH-quinone oxidoreductase subunit F
MNLPLSSRIKSDGQVTTLSEYQAADGYKGLKKALTMTPADVVNMVKDSNLRGRGGAGFNTGLKWSFVPQGTASATPKYLVCNADEMEPGTFKDRWLMECDPHQLIEGMIISAYAIQASVAYLFLRADYNLSAEVLEQAIADAYNAGLLGENILASDYSLTFYLHTSAGRYICGEETALINSLEGRRANPRAKPPFPQVSGLFGKPTVVNNVETLCNIPHILANGIEWYQSLGIGEDAGTKLYGVSGKVKNPGVWELPIGTPIREILELHAGGMQDGLTLKGFLPGGGSTDFLTEAHLDLPMDYGSIAKAGSRMGTGTMIVLDDKTCPIGMVLNLTQFFAQESCGWCTPCRNGLPFVREILTRIENGQGTIDDLDTLLEYCGYMGPGNTFCALAPGAAEPIQSALKYFKDDFIEHIEKGCCPYE